MPPKKKVNLPEDPKERTDEILRRMLSMPPDPRLKTKKSVKKKGR
jgi:hypothetical protein